MEGIEHILSPQSIAVVGATNRPGSIGLAIFRNLLDGGYQGILYPVNPKAKSIQGVKAYPSLLEIPDEVDMAVLIVPPGHVANTIEEAAKKQIKACMVITAGFKEIGGQGVELEKHVKSVAKAHGIRLLGPNCLGAANTNPNVRMNASFAGTMPSPGNIAFISQVLRARVGAGPRLARRPLHDERHRPLPVAPVVQPRAGPPAPVRGRGPRRVGRRR